MVSHSRPAPALSGLEEGLQVEQGSVGTPKVVISEDEVVQLVDNFTTGLLDQCLLELEQEED